MCTVCGCELPSGGELIPLPEEVEEENSKDEGFD